MIFANEKEIYYNKLVQQARLLDLNLLLISVKYKLFIKILKCFIVILVFLVSSNFDGLRIGCLMPLSNNS